MEHGHGGKFCSFISGRSVSSRPRRISSPVAQRASKSIAKSNWEGGHSGIGVQSALEQLEARTLLTNTVTIESVSDAFEEGPTSGSFTFHRTGTPEDLASNLTVQFSLGGTATISGPNPDYGIGSTAFFDPNSDTAIAYVFPYDDQIAESPETVVLSIVDGPGYVGSGGSGTVTIYDNDSGTVPLVSVVATDHAAEAGPNTGTYTFTRTGSTALPLTISFTMSGSAAATSPNQDYQTLPSSVQIPSGFTSTTLILTPVDDSLVESTEQAVLTINPNSSLYTVTGSPASMDIIDNDQYSTPVVAIFSTPPLGDPNAAEAGSDTGTFVVTRTGGNLSAELQVVISFVGSTARPYSPRAIGCRQCVWSNHCNVIRFVKRGVLLSRVLTKERRNAHGACWYCLQTL